MFTLAKGFDVHDLSGIEEGFGIRTNDDHEWFFKINVSVEHIRSTFFGLAALVGEPTYAYIDVPANRDVHEKLNAKGSQTGWANSYLRDKTNIDDLGRIFDFNPDMFIHDGMIKYGFGCKTELDYVHVGKFKLFRIYTLKPKKYYRWLKSQEIPEREPLRTVWDNFTDEHPGVCNRLTLSCENCYALMNRLLAEGFFFNRHIEEE